ncbi:MULTISPECIES: murein hydrolase activator EnvC family protein [Mesonia]|uniref:Murein hydrolase activator EnvC n=1 Tax=Mesonia oceanica TaxID=2687242 RepID=A0AC61YC17_9FLAO|nr:MULTISPECIES: peptidoglycan DD-metalloendopeptidase family protein [Mesonia]MAN27014.1 peptidase M23 [Mesonia sp.]VVV01923.1 Murein hydrolase activator EnvC [Mesonia oceanica]|tara:strand:- start:161 stop:1384 length:1224 start_codon:yes stop_codon:yes gene_type:complete
MNQLSLKYLACIFLFIGISFHSFSQTKERQKLEKQRLALRQEIKEINSLISNNKQKQRSVLTQVEDLDKRIRATENLIRVTNQEANLLTKEINTNLNKIDKLRKDLEKLKEDYAKMIKKSYKSKSQQSRIMFLFSSETFLQAYKRLQYMQQYTEYRKEQGIQIKAQTEELQQLNQELVEQKKAKENLLAENRVTQSKLLEDKKQQEELVASIKKKTNVFESQIKEKQQEITKIDKEIDRLIREAIAAENKKQGSTSSNKFKLTPEAKELAANFTSNKGKLPWPVKSGVIAMRFGEHPHPVVKTAKIQSNGVRIETNENEPVRSVFNGTVFQIQVIKGSNKLVLVRHGDYISVYRNLSSINVEVGDQLTTNQVIGKVGKSTATGRPTLYFSLFRNTNLLNPELWIYKM